MFKLTQKFEISHINTALEISFTKNVNNDDDITKTKRRSNKRNEYISNIFRKYHFT